MKLVKRNVLVTFAVLLTLAVQIFIPVTQAHAASPIVYPPDITTDTQKLQAVSSLIEQMRLLHNIQGAIAKSDWKKYQAQWVTYTKIFDAKIQPLLEEKAQLQDRIVWSNLIIASRPQKFSTFDSLITSSKTWEASQTTATYDGLTSLSKITIDSVIPGTVVDPLEDYTTYTEVDPNNWYGVSSANITFNNALDTAASYIYKDFTANHFDAISEYFETSVSNVNPNGDQTTSSFTVSQVGDYSGRGTSDMSFMIRAPYPRFVLVRGERTAYDYWDGAYGAVYYVWIQRSAGSSTITAKMYTDATRTTLVKTLSVTGYGTSTKYRYHYGAASWNGDGGASSQVNAYMANDDLNEGGGGTVAPTVTTQAATNTENTTTIGNGNITNTGGENPNVRGIQYGTSTGNYTSNVSDSGSFGTGAFTENLTGLSPGTTYYLRAFATNSAGTGYGSEVTVLTKPSAPTNVSATDGTSTTNVTVTWTASTGASDYHVYRDTTDLGATGNVTSYADTGASAPTIASGNASATDGTSTTNVTLTLSNVSSSNGTSHTYKVYALNATGNSSNSTSDTGYRGTTTLTYQWQISSSDADSGYSNIGGATTATYTDNTTPAPTISSGNATASDGTSASFITLTLSGHSANNGEGRYFKALVSMNGAASANSTSDRGYRGTTTLTYQWERSAADSDAAYSDLPGATTNPFDDVTAPSPTVTAGNTTASDGTSTAFVTLTVTGAATSNGTGRYYKARISMTGASDNTSTSDRGYTGGLGGLTYQFYRSAGDSDAAFSVLGGATTNPYNDTTAPAPIITPGVATASSGTSTSNVTLNVAGQSIANGAGRYYYAVVTAGSASDNTSHDRGYRVAGSLSYAWYRSATNADLGFSAIPGGTTANYEDTNAPLPNITNGVATASQGTYPNKVSTNVSGQSANVGDTRFFYCELSAPNSTSQSTNHPTGYIGVGALTYQWQKSAGASDAAYSDMIGATTQAYDDMAPSLTEIRYYRVVLNATGATQQITLGVQGWVTGVSGALPLAPTNFLIIQTGLGSISINWTMGILATSTVIRAKQDTAPTSLSDGYEIFSGNATSTNLTGLNLDNSSYFFRAWSQNGLGYSVDSANGSIGGETMTFLAFIVLAIAFTISTFWIKKPMAGLICGLVSAFTWLLVAGLSFSKQTGMSDPYFYAFLFGLAMTVIMPIATWEIYHRAKEETDDWEEEREYKHRERTTLRPDTISASDRLRLKHGMGLSAARRRREINRDTGWDD